MQTTYMHPETRSVISLSEPGLLHPRAWTVNRVSVLMKHRGRRFASLLMRRMIEDADTEGALLVLSVEPDGSPNSLDFPELFKFYSRYGFRPMSPFPMMLRDVSEVYNIGPWLTDDRYQFWTLSEGRTLG